MSKVNTIARLDPRIVYTGAAWSNIGTATQNPVAGGVGNPTNALNGRGQFGVGSGGLNGYPIAKGTGAGITPMVSGVDFTYDSRLDTTGGSNVNVYDTGTASNLASGKYFRIVEGASNIASSIYPKSPGTPSYGLQIVAKDLTTEVSPPATQCYVDPVKGKFVLPRPVYWSKCESWSNITTPELGSGSYSVTGSPTLTADSGKFNNCIKSYTTDAAIYSYITIPLSSRTGAISYWFNRGSNSQAKIMVELKTISSTYAQIRYDTSKSLVINGSTEHSASATGISDSTWYHVFITFDLDAGLSGGKRIRVFVNTTEITELSTTTASASDISTIGLFLGSTSSSASYSRIDNIKIWKDIIEDSSFEYNSGTGRESALHYIYGSANNYAPAITGTNNGVCYDYTALPTDPVKLVKGSDVTATLENASNILNGAATFGNPSNLSTNAFVQLVAGTHFQYNKRLDASTTEDATNGFGSVAGGMMDTGVSGSLASNKYIRIVEDGAVSGTKNIVDAAGLNLDVYAKEIITPGSLTPPPAGKCYVDPVTGRFVLPRPTYWSKCESAANLTTGEIGTARYTTYWVPYFSFPAGKFGNCIQQSTNPLDSFSLYIAENVSLTSATISVWCKWITAGGNSSQFVKFGNLWIYFGEFKGISLNGGSSWETAIALNSLAENNWYHAYVLVDFAKGLAGGKSVRMFMNGVEKASSTSTLPSLTSAIITMGCMQPGLGSETILDNVKYFNSLCSEDPAWEYNSGTGREDALHSIYGSTNSYKPKLIAPGGVGYFKAGSFGNYATMTF